MKLRFILTSLLALSLPAGAAATPPSIDSLFVAVPATELPLLERNARLDMLDLYNYRMTAKGENVFGGTSVMTKKSANHIAVKLTESSRWEMMRLCAGTDTTYVCLHTTYCPAGETTARFYHTDWTPAEEMVLPAPGLDDFWTDNAEVPAQRQEELRRRLEPLYVEARWEETEGNAPRIALTVSTALLDRDSRTEAAKCLTTLYRRITPGSAATTGPGN